MNKTIEITIKGKVARQTNKTLYICGNSDFVVNFDFDEEWNEFGIKTARFIHNAGYTDVVFEGNQCPVPIISNTHNIKVGVFTGNLRTTTPAYISAMRSILCGSGSPAPPSDDVYNQIMDGLNNLSDRVKALEQGGTTPNPGGTGLSENAATLLIMILQNGLFTTDQSENINALAKELGVELGDDPGEEPDIPDVPDDPVISKLANPVIWIERELEKLATPVIRLETVTDEGDEGDSGNDTDETTPAILGVAVLGRTILGEYGGTLPKLSAPVIRLETVTDDSEEEPEEIPKLDAPVISLETVTEPEDEEPEEPVAPKLDAPVITLETVVMVLDAPVIELVEV